MGDFRKLIAWQKGHAYALAVHAAFKGRRANASPGLRAQILRAVNSIPDNLAEGCAKRSRKELAVYADSAYASSKEVENDLLRAHALGILTRHTVRSLLDQGDEVSRLCYGLSRPVRPNASEPELPTSDQMADVRDQTSDVSQFRDSSPISDETSDVRFPTPDLSL